MLYSAMANIGEQINRILCQAASEIRELGAVAFRSSDDEAVAQVHGVVTQLKRLLMHLNGNAGLEVVGHQTNQTLAHERKLVSAPVRRQRKRLKKEYPKFLMRKGALVRIGWSKKQKQEYEHRVPHDAFERTVWGMQEVANRGSGPYTADDLIAVVNSRAEDGVPNYQVYVVLGLLRDQGCIEQLGREGYRFNSDIVRQANAVWDRLSVGST